MLYKHCCCWRNSVMPDILSLQHIAQVNNNNLLFPPVEMSSSMSQALTCLVATLHFQYLSPGLTGLLASSMIELWANTGLLKICANSFKLLCTTHDTPRLGLRAEPREHHTSLYTTTAQIQSPSIVNKLYKCYYAFHNQPFFTILLGWSIEPRLQPL